MEYKDAKHRPHAVHSGEEPNFDITNGPESLSVVLDRWTNHENLFPSMYDALQSNWGDRPSRTVFRPCPVLPEFELVGAEHHEHYWTWEHQSGRCRLQDEEWAYIETCFAGKTLQQVLEPLTFSFTIDGVTRAFTHEFVRARIGSGFMQHGGRDNDWRHRSWTMPETIRRAIDLFDNESRNIHPLGQHHCIQRTEPIREHLAMLAEVAGDENFTLKDAISTHLQSGRLLYAALVDAGIPWQDARRLLPIGTQTYIHGDFNYLALKGVLANRLEHIMDWEINCVAQLMLREIHMKCPPIFAAYLGSHSDLAGAARLAGLESWPPDGKYPNPYERCGVCGHAKANHRRDEENTAVCEVCLREEGQPDVRPWHKYVGVDSLPRQHRPSQMPFFVLHPDSMLGEPVKWLWTNGNYADAIKQIAETRRQ